jgi:hypothetical protein
MQGGTVEALLARTLDALSCFGYCVTSVTSEFSKIDVGGE